MRENNVPDDAQAVVLAVMRGRFQRRPGQQGQKQPFRPGGGFQNRNGQRPGMPPRGAQDLSCVNCGEKGHMANACPQPQIADKSKRPCFICKKVGCRAATCPQRKVRQPVKALEDVRRDASGRVLCVEFGPPASSSMPVLAISRPPTVDSDGFAQARRPAPMMLGHFLAKPQRIEAKKRGSRFRPLTTCEAGQCGQSCSHDAEEVEGIVDENVVTEQALPKPCVIDNSTFPTVADSRPILKGKSRVIRLSEEDERWLDYIEGRTEVGGDGLETSDCVLLPLDKPDSAGCRVEGRALSHCLGRPAHAGRSHPLGRGTMLEPFPDSMCGGRPGSSSLEHVPEAERQPPRRPIRSPIPGCCDECMLIPGHETYSHA